MKDVAFTNSFSIFGTNVCSYLEVQLDSVLLFFSFSRFTILQSFPPYQSTFREVLTSIWNL